MKKANIFGGIKVWGRFNFNLPRKFSFKWLKEWDWAAWSHAFFVELFPVSKEEKNLEDDKEWSCDESLVPRI